MKRIKKYSKIIIGLIITTFSIHVNAQAPPQGINYQAVALDEKGKEIVGRDIKGAIIPDKDISVRFSILDATFESLYIEEHNTNTDQYGMFNLVIGEGETSGGTIAEFAKINWSNGKHFLRVEIDIKGGKNYVLMGQQQLLSVPYSLHSGSSDTTLKEADPLFKKSIAAAITEQDTTLWNLDNDPSNEIQELSISKDTISLSNGGGVVILPKIDYKDLLNQPSFKDSINQYGFDGDYQKLNNQPRFGDTVTKYGFDGDYRKLNNQPTFVDTVTKYGFDGEYSSLKNKANYRDTVTKYGFDGDYKKLNNQPTFGDTVTKYGFDGEYSSLKNKANYRDTVSKYGFDGDYRKLNNQPRFSDTVTKYGFDGDYRKLNNQPKFGDSVSKYGFDGDYQNLSNKPNLANVATSGDYRDLNNQPTFGDTVTKYGFDGDYQNLSNKPNLANVATSGDYRDLINQPNLKDSVKKYSNSYLNGSTDPTASVGDTGDFYINTVNSTLFGPKTASGWGSPTSLVGPAGNYTAGSGIIINNDTISIDTSALPISNQGVRRGFSSSTTWTCPPGVTQITVELWGGAGGKSGRVITTTVMANGGNGGKGGYIKSLISVIPGNNYNITIGAGGNGSLKVSFKGCTTGTVTGLDAQNGNLSSFNNLIFANGGMGGKGGTAGGGGICGTAVSIAGNNGADGQIINFDYPTHNRSYIPSSIFPQISVALGANDTEPSGDGKKGEDGFCIISY